MTIRGVLWDFGDTLADQDWMLRPPEGYPEWPTAWSEAARGEWESAWYLNERSCEDIAERVSRSLGMSRADTMDHIQRCCSELSLFEAPLDAARASSLPQAIVTVNPDLFTRFIVPFHHLDELFPVIVTSWEEGTVDKAKLCSVAVERMGIEPEDALLIDNLEENVRGWERAGGPGYVFRGEARFTADLATSLGRMLKGPSA
jgi:FMN phosphatase YigB (HAD superfamily)